MNRIKTWVKGHKKLSIFIGIVVAIILIIIITPKKDTRTKVRVTKHDVVNSILLSGSVQNEAQADLGFAASGRVQSISVKNNQQVIAGQKLAQLEIGDLLAQRKIMEAQARGTNVDVESAKDNLDKVTAEENAKVANAYRNLLTDGLVAIPNSLSQTQTPPTLSGLYDGPEGQYKIIIRQDNPTLDNYDLLTFDLEATRVGIEKEQATTLGTHGLYVSFVDDLQDYVDTVWYLDIPNKKSTVYITNLNAYNAAKTARDTAIRNAEFNYKKILSTQSGPSTAARGEIDRIDAQIRQSTIYAPFAGVVTNIEKQIGENATNGERIISVLGSGNLEVVLEVPELDAPKISLDSKITVTFDAFPGEEFAGTLRTINSRQTEIDGVPIYEAFVTIAEDARIRPGMSAKGDILIAEKDGVLAIPQYLITTENGKNFVTVIKSDGKEEKREVKTGLRGVDSNVEIIEGVKENEIVVSN